MMVYQSECTHSVTIKIAEGIRMCDNPTCRRLILTNYVIKNERVTLDWDDD